jgi:hypothetical protein
LAAPPKLVLRMMTFAPIRGSPVSLSKIRALILPDSAADKGCEDTQNATASIEEIIEILKGDLPINIVFSFGMLRLCVV